MDYAEVREAFFQLRDAGAPEPGTSGWQSPTRRLRDAIEPIATICYWSEPAYDAYAALGLDFLQGYVWSRGCVLGEPDGSVVAAAFGVFEPGLIGQLYDAARAAAGLADIRAAREDRGRHRAARGAGRRRSTGWPSGDRRAAPGRRGGGHGRPPLFAGLAGLPWPADELGQLWHACAMLRELRGDSHLAACVAAGLTGLEANILTELQVGWPLHSYTATRGWPPEAMDLATISLRERGLIGDDALTGAGASLRADIEEATDRQLAPAGTRSARTWPASWRRSRSGPSRSSSTAGSRPTRTSARPAERARLRPDDHLDGALGHAPPAVAVGTMQVAVADAADDVLQPGQRSVGVGGGIREHGRAHPSVNGSRVAPVSSTQTDLVSVYSRMASTPFSRPMPLAPNPPKGTCGATTR